MDNDDKQVKVWLEKQSPQKLPAGRAYGADSLREWSNGRQVGYYGPDGLTGTNRQTQKYSKRGKGKLVDD